MQMILAGLRSLDSVSGSRYYSQLMEKIQTGSSEFISGRDSMLIDLDCVVETDRGFLRRDVPMPDWSNEKIFPGGKVKALFSRLYRYGKPCDMAFDYKKEYKEFYMPKGTPSIVTVPKMNYIAVRGSGNPNDAEEEYKQAMETLSG